MVNIKKIKNLIISLFLLPICCTVFLFGCNNNFYFPKDDENFENSVIYAVEYLTGETYNTDDGWTYEILNNTKNDFKINFNFSYYNVYTQDGKIVLGDSIKSNQGDIILQYKSLKKILKKNEKITVNNIEITNNFIKDKLVKNDIKNNNLNEQFLFSFVGIDKLIKNQFNVDIDGSLTNQLSYNAKVYFTFNSPLTFEKFYSYYNEKSHYGISQILIKTGDNEDSILLQLDAEKFKAATQIKFTNELMELANLDNGGFLSVLSSDLFNIENVTPESLLNYVNNNNNLVYGFVINNKFPLFNSSQLFYNFDSSILSNNSVHLNKFVLKN